MRKNTAADNISLILGLAIVVALLLFMAGAL